MLSGFVDTHPTTRGLVIKRQRSKQEVVASTNTQQSNNDIWDFPSWVSRLGSFVYLREESQFATELNSKIRLQVAKNQNQNLNYLK